MATIRDVELVSVGDHAASTGRTKVTPADLDSMLAAQLDGLVDHAPIKLGHVSSLNDAIGDGAPAYGWVKPTRIGPRKLDGVPTLFGDLVAMPDLLAAVAPTAYRRRSVEIAWNVKTPAGKTYPALVYAVALLGETPPAVKGLADLVSTYAHATDQEPDRSTVYLVDGLEAKVDAVAMLSAARDAGASTAVVDAIAAAAGASDTADVPPPVADDVNDETTSPPAAPAPPAERITMTVTDEQLRKLLKIEEGKDLDEAVAELLKDPTPEETAAAAAAVAGATPPAVPAATPGVDTVPAGTATTPPELVGAGGVATLSAETLASLQRDAAWAQGKRRDEVLDNAIRAGKISPAERSAFAAQLEANEEGTTALITALAPRFAVSELGAATAGEVTTTGPSDEAWDEFNKTTFTGLGQ